MTRILIAEALTDLADVVVRILEAGSEPLGVDLVVPGGFVDAGFVEVGFVEVGFVEVGFVVDAGFVVDDLVVVGLGLGLAAFELDPVVGATRKLGGVDGAIQRPRHNQSNVDSRNMDKRTFLRARAIVNTVWRATGRRDRTRSTSTAEGDSKSARARPERRTQNGSHPYSDVSRGPSRARRTSSAVSGRSG